MLTCPCCNKPLVYEFGGWTLDLGKNMLDGKRITQTQAKLMAMLISGKEDGASFRSLGKELYPWMRSNKDMQSVYVQLSRLRRQFPNMITKGVKKNQKQLKIVQMIPKVIG